MWLSATGRALSGGFRITHHPHFDEKCLAAAKETILPITGDGFPSSGFLFGQPNLACAKISAGKSRTRDKK
jgi:hypothetical protein